MTTRMIIPLLIAAVITLSVAGVGFSAHEIEKGVIKGTVTKIEATEYEVTVKDDKGKETKVKVKDLTGLKVGESAVIKGGKAAPAVKPRTGGY